jgi:hypothetical protein
MLASKTITTMSIDETKRQFLNMSADKQRRLCDEMTKLFIRLEADWKSKPENSGKTVSYTELWKDYEAKMKSDRAGGLSP